MTIVDQPIGSAVLYVSSTVDDVAAAAFDEWCDTIHHFDTMRIPGFLSLRRLRLVDGVDDGVVPVFRLLTLYQVDRPETADTTTPAYEAHTASYTPPPPGVTDHITFERSVYERRSPGGSTQRVGGVLVSVAGDDAWLDEVDAEARAAAAVLSTTRLTGEAGPLLLVDVEDVEAGRAVLARVAALDAAGRRRWVRLFEQVFPSSGVLVRDRVFVR